MKVTPIGDKVLVKRLESETKTKGGIVLPDTAKEKPKEGKVIAVGEGRLLEDGTRLKLTVKPGDRVVFSSFAGSEIKINDEEHLVISEEDILAIIEE